MRLSTEDWQETKIPHKLKVCFSIISFACESIGLFWYFYPAEFDGYSIIFIAAGFISLFFAGGIIIVRIFSFFIGLFLIIIFCFFFFKGIMNLDVGLCFLLGGILISIGGGPEFGELIVVIFSHM
jgi:hypothetical protein